MLSVIIPIYNVEKYLYDCLQSCFVASKNHEVQFLLIDDGSKDNSKVIANQFCEKYENFNYYYKDNGGLSDARNYGLLQSKYDYIFFLDSDDKVSIDCFDLIFEKIEQKPDIIVFDMLFVWENSDETKYLKCFDESDDPINSLLLKTPSACNKVFKKQHLLDNKFPLGLYYEDLATIPNIYLQVKKVSYINSPLYIYLQRTGSIIYTFSDKTLDIFVGLNRIVNKYKDNDLFEKYNEQLEYFCIEHLLLYSNRRFFNSNNPKDYFKLSSDFMLKYFSNWKNNSYYKNMSLNDKLFIKLSFNGNVMMLKSIINLKKVIKGK